jgi:FemAB-related protein (PEP-CTERM system-associated)
MHTVASYASTGEQLEVRTGIDPVRWDRFVESRPEASIYHRSAWANVFSNAFGHDTRYLAATDGGEIVGVLPLVQFKSRLFARCLVSLPFLNYGGLVAATEHAERALLDAAIGAARAAGASYVEFRHTRQCFAELPSKTHKVAMVLPLASTADQQFSQLDRKVRNQIRKAQKSGISMTIGGLELLDAFYDVFATNMRDLGTPVYTKAFFREVLTAFPEHAQVFCALLEGQTVAASIVLRDRNRMEVPWASALAQFNTLAPNMLLYWEMLRTAVEQGCTHFDFGRCTPNAGTHRFKAQWGAVPHQLCWEYWLASGQSLPNLSPDNARYSTAIRVWRKLPLNVTKIVGPWIVRNIP